ncbi:MAG TPA: hypothetical protein VFW34_01465 [Candidatus Rubrimentiphilum sp.]|nr:hypothetical protein [Candidatus Rubrimentiphilum sp.]
MSAFLTTALAATSIAPALAGPHEHGGQGPARGAAAAAQPQPKAQAQTRGDAGGGRHAREMIPQPAAAPAQRPMRVETRPARVENVPQPRFENRPMRVENRPARIENGPQRRFENRPMRVENRPVRFVERPVKFEQRARRDNGHAPFADVVRPRVARFRGDDRTAKFVAGRVVRTNGDDVFIENPVGQVIEVRGWHGRHRHLGWAKQMMTIPVVFQNGAYYAVAPSVVPVAYGTYVYPQVVNYGYAPDYGYVTDNGYAPVYSYGQNTANDALASTLAGVVTGLLSGSNGSSLTHSLLTNYLTSYALSSLGGNTTGFAPVYAPSYVAPAAFAPIASPLTYTYPMTCVYHDPYDGSSYYDPSCAPAAATTYYTSASAYAPAQVQGVVVGTSGSTLMVLGSNGMKPVLVNDAAALSNGLAFSGQPAAGRLVTAYGFYDGNTFVATALQ